MEMDDVRLEAKKLYSKGFGDRLNTVYTYDRHAALPKMNFSKRYRVVIAMLEAMLHEEEMIRQEEANGSPEQAT